MCSLLPMPGHGVFIAGGAGNPFSCVPARSGWSPNPRWHSTPWACSRCASIFSLAAFVLAEHRVGASILVARLLCHFVAGPKVLVGIKGMFWIGSEVLLNPHLILMLIIFFAFGASLRSECAGSLLGWF